jgi:hypothetical protein
MSAVNGILKFQLSVTEPHVQLTLTEENQRLNMPSDLGLLILIPDQSSRSPSSHENHVPNVVSMG